MRIWNRVVSAVAVFAAFSMVAAAGQAPREGRGPGARMDPKRQVKLIKESAPLVCQVLAKALKLSEDQAKKLTEAYVAEATAQVKKRAEIMQSDDQEKRRAYFRESRESMQKAMQEALGKEKGEKAAGLLRTGPDRSIQALIRAKTETAKIKEALPLLTKHHEELVGLYEKMREEGADRRALFGKMREMREATAKELAKIVGEEAAAAWQKGGMRGMRFGGGRGGERPGGEGGGREG